MKNKYEIHGDVTIIYISHKGKEYKTIIDTDSLEIIREYTGTWGISHGYAIQKKNKKIMLLHTVIMKVMSNEYDIDHINRDKLDNRTSNLRLCSHAQNMQNLSLVRKNSRSGKRGVSWSSYHKKWCAELRVENKKVFVGYFDSVDEADKAVRDARSKLMPFSSDALTRQDDSGYFKDANKPLSNNKLGIRKNVHYDEIRDKYAVRFAQKGKQIFFQRFNSLEEAMKVAEEVRNKLKSS